MREDPLWMPITAIVVVILVATLAITSGFWYSEKTEAQKEEWTPPTIQTYKIPIDTGTGHVLHMYDPNGRITCLVWIRGLGTTLPLGCVAGKR